jgi:hypothetical protein
MLMLLEDFTALLAQFIGAAGEGHAGQHEQKGEKDGFGVATHRSSLVEG